MNPSRHLCMSNNLNNRLRFLSFCWFDRRDSPTSRGESGDPRQTGTTSYGDGGASCPSTCSPRGKSRPLQHGRQLVVQKRWRSRHRFVGQQHADWVRRINNSSSSSRFWWCSSPRSERHHHSPSRISGLRGDSRRRLFRQQHGHERR